MIRSAIGWGAAVTAYAGWLSLLPVYVPICVGMWTYFYVTDMQGNTHLMLSQRLNQEH